jgi:hypothetical protein
MASAANTPTALEVYQPILAQVDGAAPVLVVSAEILAEIADLDAALAALAAMPEDPDTVHLSDPIGVRAARIARQLEADRVAVKSIPLELCRAIDAAAKDPAATLNRIKVAIEQRHTRIHVAVERRRLEAEAARRRAEAAALEAEAAATRAREAAARAQAERDRQLAELAASAHSVEDTQVVDELALEAERATQVEADAVAEAAQTLQVAASEAYLASLDATPAPAPKTSTTISRVLVLEITDASKIPDAIELAGGQRIALKSIDRKALDKALRLGIVIDGARLIPDVRTSTRGGR